MAASQPALSRHDDPNIPSDEDTAWPFTKIFYGWVSPVLWRGWARAANQELLTSEDLVKLKNDERAAATYAIFKESWASECARVKGTREPPSLFSALRKSFMGPLYIGAICRIVADACLVSNPFCLQQFIAWLANYVFDQKNQQLWVGYVWALGIAAIMFVQALAMNGQMFFSSLAFFRMRTCVQLAIFDKALTLPGGHGLTGIITAMHATDTTKFLDLGQFIHIIWAGPVVVIAALGALYYFIGWAGLLSIVVIIVLTPPQMIIGNAMIAARGAASRCGDRRLGLISEVLQAIRIVKFMNWEEEFKRRVAIFRQNELVVFGRLLRLRSAMIMGIVWIPSVITLAVFAIAYGFGTSLTPKNVFPTIAMLGVLRMPLSMMPLSLGRLVDLRVALGRIGTFLQTPERTPFLTFDESLPDAVRIESATVQYLFAAAAIAPQAAAGGQQAARTAGSAPGAPPPKPEARDLMTVANVVIPKGKLTLIVGPTAGGKSTLVSVLVGEALVKEGAKVTASSRIALVAQEAWIMNATVRENILMGRSFDEQKYLDAVNACELMSDFHQLDGSDETEIGERGINLSGGQKQRIAFARAVYSGREIVVMDDPLSAVDPHVCKDLFDGCICEALAGRTRVLVTHQIQFLPRADYVIVVVDRQIAFQGTYDALLQSGIDVSTLENASKDETGKLQPTTAQSQQQQDQQAIDEMPSKTRNPMAVVASPVGSPSNQEAEDAKARRNRHGTAIPKPRQDAAATTEGGGQHLISGEAMSLGAVPPKVYGFYVSSWGYVTFAVTIFCFLLWRAVMAFADLMISWWSTNTQVVGYSLTSAQYLYWYAIFTILSGILLVVRQIPFVMGALNVSKEAHRAMFNNVIHAPSWFFDTTPLGRIINRFSKDMETVDLMISEALNIFLNMGLIILGAFGVMIYGTPWLAFAIAALIGVYILFYWFFQKTNRAVKRLDMTFRSPVIAIMNEILGGLPTIRAYDMATHFSAVHFGRVDRALMPTYTWAYMQRWLGLRVDLTSAVVTLATGLITVGLLTSLSFKDQITALPVMALGITYAMTISGGVGFLTTMGAELESNMASVERIKEYSDNIPLERTVVYDEATNAPPPPTWPVTARVAFEHVHLRYREGLPLVLQDVSFSVAGGEKVGVVGRTGSGKSTVMLALFRMIELAEENPGRILLDGRDIATLTMRDLRTKITIIPQDPTLFIGTVRGNLDPFETRTDEEVWAALEKCGMKDRVARGSQGLESEVAEKGSNFSVGERQLLCLARAILKNCKLLLLDEATASIDPHQDAILQQTIRKEFADATVLTIAHRIGTIIDADKVLVLNHGRVAEFDAPAKLIANPDSVFHSMVEKLGEEKAAELKRLANEHYESWKNTLSDAVTTVVPHTVPQ